MRRSAYSFLRKAQAAYVVALAVPDTNATSAWRAAAKAGSRSADDLIRRLE